MSVRLVLSFKNRIFRLKYQQRFYSSAAPDNPNSNHNDNNRQTDLENISLIGSYPNHMNPTPYEILNFNSHSDFKPGLLKKRFFKLAKIYHPDSKHYEGTKIIPNKTFFNSNSNDPKILTQDLKDQRFKKILSAYTLLKNPILRENYDKYQVGWNDNNSHFGNPNNYNPSSQRYSDFVRRKYHKSNFTRYETGTWEDSYKYGHETAYGFYGDNSWRSSTNGDLKEEFAKNRKTILLSIILTASVYFALQLTHVYLYDDLIGGKYNESMVASNRMHDKSENDLLDAYSNYGMGNSKDERINRFLWFRQLTQLLSLGDITEILDHLYAKKIIKHDEEQQEVKLKKFDRSNIKSSKDCVANKSANEIEID